MTAPLPDAVGVVLTDTERAHIIKLLGGPLDMSTRYLGSGMTAEGVIALRQKLQGPVRPYNPSTEDQD